MIIARWTNNYDETHYGIGNDAESALTDLAQPTHQTPDEIPFNEIEFFEAKAIQLERLIKSKI